MPENHCHSAIDTIMGPLVPQPKAAARMAEKLHLAATDLWDACTMMHVDEMRKAAITIAQRILRDC